MEKLKGDGSDRQIFRIRLTDLSAKSFIAVYGANIAENKAFLSFLETFRKNGFFVPALYQISEDKRCYLLEDLGDDTVKSVCDRLYQEDRQEELSALYERLIRTLPELQLKLAAEIDYDLCYQSRVFDRDAMLYDVRRFSKYYLGSHLQLSVVIRKGVEEKLIQLIEFLAEADNGYFMFRDFQTRNMMLKNGEIFFIDFQSGRKGPLQYDLASFLYSSGTYLNESLEQRLLDLYLEKLTEYVKVDKKEFCRYLYGFGILRILQAMGGYAFLFYEKEKKDYILKVPKALNTLKILCDRAGMELGCLFA